MENTANIWAVEARDRRVGYQIEIYDLKGVLIQGISGSIVGKNALVKVRFHVGGIYLPQTKFVSKPDIERIRKIARERNVELEIRADNAISLNDGASNFFRELKQDEKDYLEQGLGVKFE